MFTDSGIPTGFVIFFVVVVVLMAAFFIFMFVALVHRWRVAKRSGLDPMAGDIQLMAAARNSQLLAPADPKARLDELDRLLADGTITADERARERARILGEM
jgi:hypothetical protein